MATLVLGAHWLLPASGLSMLAWSMPWPSLFLALLLLEGETLQLQVMPRWHKSQMSTSLPNLLMSNHDDVFHHLRPCFLLIALTR